MQCSQPLVIKNRKINYVKGIDKPFLTVPCGHCPSCRISNQNDWFSRAYWHWKYYLDVLQGCCVFITLTYNNQEVPYFVNGHVARASDRFPVIVRKQPKRDVSFMCFDKKDIDRYINSVKKCFKREFDLVGIDYLVCCEYGGNRTKRPHYHLLVYIPYVQKIKSKFPYTYRAIIKDRLARYWRGYQEIRKTKKGKDILDDNGIPILRQVVKPKGFVIYSKQSKGGAFVDNPKAIEYVSKYVTKDIDYYNIPNVKTALLDQHYKDELKKGYLPKHYQSKGFGAFLCDAVLDSSNPFDTLSKGFKKPLQDSKDNVYRSPIPGYVRSKLTKDIIVYSHKEIKPHFDKKTHKYLNKEYTIYDNVFTKPSAFGLDLNLKTYYEKVKTLTSRFSDKYSLQGLASCFGTSEQLNSFITSHFSKCLDTSITGWYLYLNKLLHGRTYEELAIYKLVYYNKVYDPNFYPSTFDCYSLDSMLANAHHVYKVHEQFKRDFEPMPKIGKYDPTQDVRHSFASLCSEAADFEYLLYALDLMQRSVSASHAKEYTSKYALMRKLKQRECNL